LFGNLLHLSRRGPTSFECRFLEEFEESLPILAKTVFCSFECFLHINRSLLMVASPHLHVSMPHVEKLADLLVMLLPGSLLSDKPWNNTRQTGIQRSTGAGDPAMLRSCS
jgi:hypothetical protein